MNFNHAINLFFLVFACLQPSPAAASFKCPTTAKPNALCELIDVWNRSNLEFAMTGNKGEHDCDNNRKPRCCNFVPKIKPSQPFDKAYADANCGPTVAA
ncbi:hypothetical protein O181_031235 [Austropuccinia psidii MF-1]|uniref:Hydrophobin n=1 Tax=Austropuccinia psidii MF-1 TaxID=1389203 RepID=A0A9Q3CXL2_9BASI|nr:hypothetical protein [Austropuccinia psidii MF-1]